jgi:hypothetical protein
MTERTSTDEELSEPSRPLIAVFLSSANLEVTAKPDILPGLFDWNQEKR